MSAAISSRTARSASAAPRRTVHSASVPGTSPSRARNARHTRDRRHGSTMPFSDDEARGQRDDDGDDVPHRCAPWPSRAPGRPAGTPRRSTAHRDSRRVPRGRSWRPRPRRMTAHRCGRRRAPPTRDRPVDRALCRSGALARRPLRRSCWPACWRSRPAGPRLASGRRPCRCRRGRTIPGTARAPPTGRGSRRRCRRTPSVSA